MHDIFYCTTLLLYHPPSPYDDGASFELRAILEVSCNNKINENNVDAMDSPKATTTMQRPVITSFGDDVIIY